jgi:hypothetical protein
VSHDFNTWRETLSERAVVLFHDVREYQEGFGVHRYWDELRGEYPSFTFEHGHGLGVLAVGPNVPDDLLELCAVDAQLPGNEVRAYFEELACWAGVGQERDHFRAEWEARGRELDVMRGERDQLSRELDVMRGERDQLGRVVDAITHSASWRLTKPIRRLRSTLRGT